jgi:hypothetical protein
MSSFCGAMIALHSHIASVPSVRCFTQAAIFVLLFRGYLTGPIPEASAVVGLE